MGIGEWKGTHVSSIHRGIVSTVSFYVQVLQEQDFSRCPFFPYGIHFFTTTALCCMGGYVQKER